VLKAPGIKRLKLTIDEPLSSFAFKFNLRRCNEETNSFETIAVTGGATTGENRYSDATAVGRGFQSFACQLNVSRLCC